MTIALPQFRAMTGATISVDPHFSSVKFLWHADGSNGQSPNYTPTVGSTISGQGPGQGSLSTTQVKFGSTSYAAGTDAVRAATSANYTIGTADFAIEMWAYLSAVTGNRVFFDCRPATTEGAYPVIGSNGTDLLYYVSSATRITGTGALSSGTWLYICVARDSGSTRAYVGTSGTASQVGSTWTDGTTYMPSSTGIYLAESSFNGGAMSGYLDEIRLTVGTSRGFNGASIAVPTAPFPNS